MCLADVYNIQESQMLDFFGYANWGERLITCIEEVLVEKKILTPDLGGNSTTVKVGNEILKKLAEMV